MYLLLLLLLLLRTGVGEMRWLYGRFWHYWCLMLECFGRYLCVNGRCQIRVGIFSVGLCEWWCPISIAILLGDKADLRKMVCRSLNFRINDVSLINRFERDKTRVALLCRRECKTASMLSSCFECS